MIMGFAMYNFHCYSLLLNLIIYITFTLLPHLLIKYLNLLIDRLFDINTILTNSKIGKENKHKLSAADL